MDREIERLSEDLVIRGYSPRTIALYTGSIRVCARHFGKRPLDLSTEDLRAYLLHLRQRGRSDSTIHIYHEAFKRFFTFHGDPGRVSPASIRRGPRRLPVILDEGEIVTLFSTCRSLKMRTILSLIFSAGMRISELVNLDIGDIDFGRGLIRLKDCKNRKDRLTILAVQARQSLREYLLIYRPRQILFYSRSDPTLRIAPCTIQRSFKRLLADAGINKPAKVHSLRHSFATHLLHSGTNIFDIMKLLGHASLKSTLIYLHALASDISTIESPLDRIFRVRHLNLATDPTNPLFEAPPRLAANVQPPEINSI